MPAFIQLILKKLFGEELDEKIRNYFLKGSFQSLFLQIALSLLTFLTSIVVARLTGDKGFGVYSLVFTWVSVFSTLALFGLDDLALKQLPIFQSNKNGYAARKLMRWGHKTALLASLLIMLVYLGMVNLLTIPGLYNYAVYHNCAAISIPFFVIIHFNQAALRGLAKFAKGQVVEKVIQPAVFLCCLVLAWLLSFEVNDFYAVLFRTVAFGLAAIVAIFLMLRTFTKKWEGSSSSNTDNFSANAWGKSAFFFMISSVLYLINTRLDMLFLGFFSIDEAEIAYYNVAMKFADISLFPFMIICTVATPLFSSLYHQHKIKELQLFYTKITRIATVLVALILGTFILFGSSFLTLYGAGFKSAYQVLLLLSLVKFIHVFIGPANYLLFMVGEEKALSIALMCSILLSIALNYVLIPLYAIKGAALANLGSLLFFELIIMVVTYRKTGIVLGAFGKLAFKKKID